MAFRIHLLFVYTALCLLSLYQANAFKAFDWLKVEPRVTAFSWSDCGAASDPVHVLSLAVGPDPVKIPGNLSIATSFRLGPSSGKDLGISLVMDKKVAGVYIKIPCIDNIGSCTYSGLCAGWPDTCHKYFEKYGIPCTCPIPPNTYTIPETVVDIKAKLPAIVSGTYRLTANFVSDTQEKLGCLQVIVNLEL